MQVRLVSIAVALALIPATLCAQEISTKPHLLGTWQNSQASPGCDVFPLSVTIKSATDTSVDIESKDRSGRVRIWTGPQSQLYGPPGGPDTIRLKFVSFEYADGKMRYMQVGPDGQNDCVFQKAERDR